MATVFVFGFSLIGKGSPRRGMGRVQPGLRHAVSSMLIKVRSYGLMRKYTSHLSSEGDIEIPEGIKAADVLALLKVPADSRLVLLVNGRPSDPEHALQPRDTLVFFPPLEGG